MYSYEYMIIKGIHSDTFHHNIIDKVRLGKGHRLSDICNPKNLSPSSLDLTSLRL